MRLKQACTNARISLRKRISSKHKLSQSLHKNENEIDISNKPAPSESNADDTLNERSNETPNETANETRETVWNETNDIDYDEDFERPSIFDVLSLYRDA